MMRKGDAVQDADFDPRLMAKIIRGFADKAYGAVLVGNPAPVTKALYERMKDAQIGDLVVEISTLHASQVAVDAVGILESAVYEPAFDDWDEDKEGEPCPKETAWYLRTLDGREFRWTNARFIAVPWETWSDGRYPHAR